MIKLIDILKEINNTVQYDNPNFKKEWMEAKRYPEFKEMGKEKWIELAKQGNITQYSKIKSVLGNIDLDYKNLDKDKKIRFEQSFKKGIIEMPIAVKFDDNDYDLVAGNTRLAGLIKNNIDPNIWIVSL
jgi:hypothetical protein